MGVEHQRLSPSGQPSVKGFGNLELGLKYQFYKNDAHETLLSAGLGWEVGGTGNKSVGADSFSTFTPALFFGKGFGDLPDSMPMLKPLALTGTSGRGDAPPRQHHHDVGGPRHRHHGRQRRTHPNVLQLGFAIEYSLPYLQSFVKDVGLAAPFNRMIPLVEISMQKPLDRVTIDA